jgi:hypothetical protein
MDFWQHIYALLKGWSFCSGSTLLVYCPATGDYLDVGAMEVTKWALEKIDKIRRVFLVEGVKNASGGYCLMKWRNVEPNVTLRCYASICMAIICMTFHIIIIIHVNIII